jgi:5-methylcytosine-specific restriction protein A
MATYLLAWNPKYYPWDVREEAIDKLKSGGQYRENWSCGHTKKIESNDDVYLMKVGKEPRGIIASGIAISGYQELPHWDPERESAGDTALYIKIDFNTILNPDVDIFPLERLQQGIYSRMNWTPRASGTTIPDDIAVQLKRDWGDMFGRQDVVDIAPLPEEVDEPETYPAGAVRSITINIYERNPKARAACIKHHGVTCCVCGMNFEERYGEVGIGFINVHHLVPVSMLQGNYELDPVKDLRPVCPNCHAMLHKGPPFSIDELRAMMKNRK